MNLYRSTLVSFFSQIGSALVIFLGFALFSKLLGGENFGIFILFLAVTNVSSMIADLGIGGAVEKRISEGNGEHVLASALLAKTATLAVLALSVFLARDWINGFVGAKVALWLIITLVTRQFGRVFLLSIRGELRVAEAEAVLFGQKTLFIVVGLVLVVYSEATLPLVGGYWSSWFFVLLWGFYRRMTPLGIVSADALESIYDYSRYNFVSSVLSRGAYSWLDVLVIGFFLTPTAVAAYEMAWRLAGVVMLLSRSIGAAIFPQISHWDESDSIEKIESTVPIAIFGSLLLVIPAIGGVVVLADQLMRILFTPEFKVASAALIILTVGKVPQAVNAVTSRVLLGLDKPRYTALAAVILISSNAILNPILVYSLGSISPALGLLGAALATTSAILFAVLVSVYYLNREISVRFPTADIVFITVSSLVMTAVVYYVSGLVGVRSAVELFVVVGVGVVVYALGMVWYAPVRRHAAAGIRSVFRLR